MKELLDTFKTAKNHWIPFRTASPGEDVKGFSHKGYTELVFSKPPTNVRLENKFNLIFFDDDSQGLNLVKSMWNRLDDSGKERFYKRFSLMLDRRIRLNSRPKLGNSFMPFYDSKKRAEIYLGYLQKLYSDFLSAKDHVLVNKNTVDDDLKYRMEIEILKNNVGSLEKALIEKDKMISHLENEKDVLELKLKKLCSMTWMGDINDIAETADAFYSTGKISNVNSKDIVYEIFNEIFTLHSNAKSMSTSITEIRITKIHPNYNGKFLVELEKSHIKFAKEAEEKRLKQAEKKVRKKNKL